MVVGTARFMKVRLRVHGLFLDIVFLAWIQSCPNRGILISYDDGCKHMICYGNTTMRYQVITVTHGIEDTVVRS